MSVADQAFQKSVCVSPLTPNVYMQLTVLQKREPCRCENTGQESGPGRNFLGEEYPSERNQHRA